MSGPFSLSYLSRSSSLSVGNCQGVVDDGAGRIFFCESTIIYEYSRLGVAEVDGAAQIVSEHGSYLGVRLEIGDIYSLVTSRDVSEDMPPGSTQINGMEWYEGRLFVGANNFPDTPKAGWIIEFDPTDLSHIATHSVGANWCEGGAIKDVGDGPEFFAVYTDTDQTRRYALDDFSFIDSHLLSYVEGQTHIIGVSGLYQDAVWKDDYFFCQTHSMNPDTRTDIYRWNGNGFVPVQSIPALSDVAGQGLDFEGDPANGVLLFAERGVGSQTILRAQLTASALINPFDYLAAELAEVHPRQNHIAALRYLLPRWGDLWDDNPQFYINGYQVITNEISALADSALKEDMLRFVTELTHRR